MEDQWRKAAQKLTDSERKVALKNYLDSANEVDAGIIRQLLGKEGKPLSENQQYIYNNSIEPSLVERCGSRSCGNFVPAGTNYCATCSIEYGD